MSKEMFRAIKRVAVSNPANVKIQLFDKLNRRAMPLSDAIDSLDFSFFSRTVDYMLEAGVLIECRSTRNNEPEGWNFGLMANPNPPKEISFRHLPFKGNKTEDLAFLFAPSDSVDSRSEVTHVNGTKTFEIGSELVEDTYVDIDNETNFDISLPMFKL